MKHHTLKSKTNLKRKYIALSNKCGSDLFSYFPDVVCLAEILRNNPILYGYTKHYNDNCVRLSQETEQAVLIALPIGVASYFEQAIEGVLFVQRALVAKHMRHGFH